MAESTFPNNIHFDEGAAPKGPVTMKDDSGKKFMVSPFGHPVVSGSLAVTAEFEGKTYLAVVERQGEPMTQAGRTVRVPLPGEAPDAANATPLAAAQDSLKTLMGLTADQYPALNTPIVQSERYGVYDKDNQGGKDEPRLSKNLPGAQLHVDAGAFLGSVARLPELHGTDPRTGKETAAAWLPVDQVEKVVEQGKATYRYTGPDIHVTQKDGTDRVLYAKGAEVLPDGGAHLAEKLISASRDQQLGKGGLGRLLDDAKEYGFDAGNIKVPETQFGNAAQKIYEDAAKLNTEMHDKLKKGVKTSQAIDDIAKFAQAPAAETPDDALRFINRGTGGGIRRA